MRVFISQASRNAAHNLDDLSERWHLRKETTGSYELTVPRELPLLKTIDEAQRYRNELWKIYENLKLERAKARRHSERELLAEQIVHVTALQHRTKARIHELTQARKVNGVSGVELPSEQKWQARCFGYLVATGEAVLTQSETETTIHFPKQNKTIYIPR